jgi:hypothetical protein
MAWVRTISAIILALSVSAIAVDAQWRYKTTDDGKYRVGRNGPNMTVETNNLVIRFSVPQDWRLSDVTEDDFGCKFTAESSLDAPALEFSIHRKISGVFDPEFFEHRPPLTLAAREEAPFRLPDGRRLIPHHDVVAWPIKNSGPLRYGTLLYLYVPERDYTCTFKFIGNRLLGLPTSRQLVQQILDSYMATRKKPSNQALQPTASRCENLLP